MAKGKRKGKSKNYPVGHPLHQQSEGRPCGQDIKNDRQLTASVSNVQVSMPGRSEMIAKESISVSSSPAVAKVSTSRATSSSSAKVDAKVFTPRSPVSSSSAKVDAKVSTPRASVSSSSAKVDANVSTSRAPVSNSSAKVDAEVSTSRASVANSSAEKIAESCAANASTEEKVGDDSTRQGHITTGLPAKQVPGKLGRNIRLVSNLYPIALLPDRNVYHYDVKITKWKADKLSNLSGDGNYRCTNIRLNRAVIRNMLDNNIHFRNSNAVYDGKYNLYTPSPLQLKFPFETKIFLESENKNAEQMKTFSIQIKPVQKKNTHGVKENNCVINLAVLHELYRGNTSDVDNIQEAMVALETIFRESPSLRYIPIGRNYYHPDIGGMHPLSGGVQIWFGYHQSLRLGQWKLMVNLNTSATTFFKKQSLIDYVANDIGINVCESQHLPITQNNVIEKLKEVLRNLNIETYHQGFKNRQTIIDVTRKSASRLEFEVPDGNIATGATRTVTVARYFLEKYNVNLMYPHLPCVQVKPKIRNIYLPLEVCNIPEGEHSRKELPIADKREMIQRTADPPVEKFNKIANIRNEWAGYNEDACLKSFGIEVASQPASVKARVIDSPYLIYSENKTIQPVGGSWNIKNLEFYDSAKSFTWIILSLAPEKWCNHHDLGMFSLQLQRIGKAAGLDMGEPEAIKIMSGYRNDEKMRKAREELKDVHRRKIQLAIVVIPNKDTFLYNNVKQVAEVELGLMTQCIDSSNAKKCNASTLSNLCLNINAKMGGINHTLTPSELPPIMTKPVIVIGADVCHAGITDRTGISVAAVVGSLDMTLSRFAVVSKLQKNSNSRKKSVEIILELKDMVKTVLMSFYVHTNDMKPEKIIFYRDGVSDGQFHEVRQKEVKAIRDACREMPGEYEPAITFVTVQKRHQVRLRPENPRDEKNVPPGTVADTEIVHPVHRDFYLCSQQGLKGTSKPAHYTVLEDDNEFKMDDLQKLTNFCCYISFRCSKSISIPVPVHYADAAAYRTRLRLSTLSEDIKKRQMKSEVILEEVRKGTETVDFIKNTMYFV